MMPRLVAISLAVALLGLTAGPARAVGDGSVRPLPLTQEKCEALSARGAPFRADPTAGCIIIIGGTPTDRLVPLPFGRTKCGDLIEAGAPFQLGGPDTRAACFVIAII